MDEVNRAIWESNGTRRKAQGGSGRGSWDQQSINLIKKEGDEPESASPRIKVKTYQGLCKYKFVY